MRGFKALLLGASLSSALVPVCMAASADPIGQLSLSPGLLELFRAEMRELLLGTQTLAAALPTGNWEAVVATSRQMRASYILERKLTPDQEKELAALPTRFKDLDQSFHVRTEKLAEAAIRRDPEAAVYQYSRLIEICTACHASYAPSRFPGLSPPSHAESHY